MAARRLWVVVGPWVFASPQAPQDMLEYLSRLEYRERLAYLAGLKVCIGCCQFLEGPVARPIRPRAGGKMAFYTEGGAEIRLACDHRLAICKACLHAFPPCDFCGCYVESGSALALHEGPPWGDPERWRRDAYVICPACLHREDREEFRRQVYGWDPAEARRVWEEIAARLSNTPVGTYT